MARLINWLRSSAVVVGLCACGAQAELAYNLPEPVSPLTRSQKESGLPLKVASRLSPQVILPLRHDRAT